MAKWLQNKQKNVDITLAYTVLFLWIIGPFIALSMCFANILIGLIALGLTLILGGILYNTGESFDEYCGHAKCFRKKF